MYKFYIYPLIGGKLEFLVGNAYFLWYPISQTVEIQLPLIIILLPFIENVIKGKI